VIAAQLLFTGRLAKSNMISNPHPSATWVHLQRLGYYISSVPKNQGILSASGFFFAIFIAYPKRIAFPLYYDIMARKETAYYPFLILTIPSMDTHPVVPVQIPFVFLCKDG